ncbi:UDP-N-acetylhexosamine pyrophosphorylase [Planctomycetaceae bacterium SCGC AG-212-F19]|nr:UDP-N-acetylhexosamine pyrophosphorylase [Planctomycetaceae bacterium SCGC AG-212-F19]
MAKLPADLQQHLREHGQEHVLAWWDDLPEGERAALQEQLRAVDLPLLRRLYGERHKRFALPPADKIKPVPVIRRDADVTAARRLGTQALDRGEVAALVVAGGQGTRLGFDHPKGMFPVGPVSRKPLFQVHAEKVLALRRRHGKPIPFLVMTSDATDDETRQFFATHRCFGLSPDEVCFFRQGTMPAVDLATGKLLLESPGRLCLSPNGHGGTLTALTESGLLDRLRGQGVRHIFYYQVDNPLVKIADAVFLGHHIGAEAEASSKIVPKRGPLEKVGHLVQVDGRCMILEYSDLTEEQLKATDEGGQLRLWAGNPAIHIFSVEFLARITQGETRLPFHIARKKVPHIDAAGNPVKPEQENALKFEMFVFDALPMAQRWTVVETDRREEFEPLKNATGDDSPASVARAIGNLAADWLTQAGVNVPRDQQGNVAFPLEISPLYALDAAELATKVDRKMRIEGPTYLG